MGSLEWTLCPSLLNGGFKWGHQPWPSTRVSDKHIKALSNGVPWHLPGFPLAEVELLRGVLWSPSFLCSFLWKVVLGPAWHLFLWRFPFLWVWFWERGGRQVAWSSFCFHPFIRWNNVCLAQKLRWISRVSVPRNLWKLFRAFKVVVAPWTALTHRLHRKIGCGRFAGIVSRALNHSDCFVSHGGFICSSSLDALGALFTLEVKDDFSSKGCPGWWLQLWLVWLKWHQMKGLASWKHVCESLSDFCPSLSFTVLWVRTAAFCLDTRNANDWPVLHVFQALQNYRLVLLKLMSIMIMFFYEIYN